MAGSDGSALGVQDARTKLDGLLKDLVKKTEESEDDVSSSLGSSLSFSMPPPSTPTKRSSSGKTPRKRRKKDTGFDEADGGNQNPSFVRKLFDRSVDFAQFNEDTPLYALARAWMQNKPFGSKSSESQDNNQDGDSPSSSQERPMSTTGHSNGDSDPKHVYSFPDPIKPNAEAMRDCSFPNSGSRGLLTLNIHYDLEKAPAVNDLKKNHIDRWKKVKSGWKDYSFRKQTNYTPSIKKIRELFEH